MDQNRLIYHAETWFIPEVDTIFLDYLWRRDFRLNSINKKRKTIK